MKQQPLMFRSTCSITGMAVMLVLSLFARSAFAAPEWDMLGIRLGMTEAQVREAFKAYDPNGKIMASNAAFSYSDKVNSFRTPDFLDTLELRVTRLSIQIPLKVWFSGPVGEARVIGVARQEYNIPNPVTAAQFQQSLAGKYGQPTVTAGTMPVWEEAGKPSCIRASWGVNLGEFPQVVTGQKKIAQAVAALEALQQSSSGTLPADLASCGTFLYYTAGMDPVKAITGGMFDVGAIMATHHSRNAWVDQLEAEAVRKREGQAQAPRL